MVHQIPCRAAMNSVEWNPKYNLHAYAGDDKNKYQADEGNMFQFFIFVGGKILAMEGEITSPAYDHPSTR
ncbi:hypothetical protein Q3G72_030703 [Acer saccharum]|nr:hypothetical protein Q3G72_030703 [Acer saccharum]